MNYKHQCMYMCDLFHTKCPHAANEISSIFEHAKGPGQGCSSYVKKKNAWFVDPFNLTDAGNAKRLVSAHGDNIVYCPEMVGWYIFNGSIWEYDTKGQIFQLAKSTAIDLHVAAMNIQDDEKRKKLVGYAMGLESQKGLKNMVESTQNEPGIPININDFDKNRDLICVGNGVIDLKTSELLDFDKDEMITRQIPTNYNSDAECPQFLKFLSEILDNNIELIGFLKRFLGYCTTGRTDEQIFLILYGHGANGKGTLIDTIMYILGEYATTTEPETIMQKKYERSASNDLADLLGRRFVTTSENEANQTLDEGRIKRMTGQDLIKCRQLYKDYIEYLPEFTIALLTNHEPIIKGGDYSIWRRVLKMPFNVTIPKENWDLKLRDKLISESEGILNWLIQGAKEWYKIGLNVPDEVRTATEEYREELDILGEFIDQMCILETDKKVTNNDIMTIYNCWCSVSGYKSVSKTSLGRSLSQRGNIEGCTIGKLRGKIGIDLLDEIKDILDETKNYDDERYRVSTLTTLIRGFLESSTSDDNISESSNHPKSVDTSHPIVNQVLTNEGHSENDTQTLHSIAKTPRKINEIPPVDTIKIKLLSSKSEYNIDGIQYSLKRGDIADVPRKKAEQLINLNMAMNVSGGITA